MLSSVHSRAASLGRRVAALLDRQADGLDDLHRGFQRGRLGGVDGHALAAQVQDDAAIRPRRVDADLGLLEQAQGALDHQAGTEAGGIVVMLLQHRSDRRRHVRKGQRIGRLAGNDRGGQDEREDEAGDHVNGDPRE